MRFSDVKPQTTEIWVRVEAKVEKVAQTWSDAFANQAASLRYNLLGWDVRHMDLPPNIEDTGVKQGIFAEPDGMSTNFHMERVEKGDYVAIPMGLRYAPRSTSSMETTTTFGTNSAEHDASIAWGHEISGKDEFVLGPLEANIEVKQNVQHQARASTMRNSESSQASTKVTSAKYALVLDRANMPLADLFRTMVAEIVDGEEPYGLFEVFGTHYANAVTYGGRASRTLTMTKSGRRHVIEHGYNVANEVSVGFGAEIGDRKEHTAVGAKGQFGVKWNRSGDSSDTTETSSGLEREAIKGFGSVSAVGGIHDGDANEMPVFVDHRPITELLAPPYFDDPKITVELRARLEAVLEGELIGQDIEWGSYFVEFRGLIAGTSPEWATYPTCPRVTVDVSRYETVPWRGVNRDWPDTWNGSFRDLQEMHDEVGWLRVIAPADTEMLQWSFSDGQNSFHVEAALNPPAIFNAPIEIYRDRFTAVNVVPSHYVLSGGWAVPPPPPAS